VNPLVIVLVCMAAQGALVALAMLVLAIDSDRRARAQQDDDEVTGIQCQGCLADVRECRCPLAGER